MSTDSELLANIFQSVTKTLAENKQALNQADDQNHDHGTNMVKTFQIISNSIGSKKNVPASDALAYAAKRVSKEATSGSAKLYAQNLANAATQIKGQTISPQTGIQLLQTLIGGGQGAQQPAQTGKEQQYAQSGGGDLLSSLLGGLTGGQTQQQAPQNAGGDLLGSLLGGLSGGGQVAQQQPAQSGGEDLLGSLLGGLAGGGQAQQQAPQNTGGDLLGSLLGGLAGGGNAQPANNQNNGLDLGDLLNAGMAYMQAKQSGNSTAVALLQAILAGSGMGNSVHRQQSTQLVASSFLQALGALSGGKAR
jgi:hypothetical protein